MKGQNSILIPREHSSITNIKKKFFLKEKGKGGGQKKYLKEISNIHQESNATNRKEDKRGEKKRGRIDS